MSRPKIQSTFGCAACLDKFRRFGRTTPSAARDVLAERRRQVEAEGYDPMHDDEHIDGALSMAAAGYASEASNALLNCAHELDGPDEPALDDVQGSTPEAGIWPHGWTFKPATPRQMLVKAGALILAEIERLDREAFHTAPLPSHDHVSTL